MLDKNQNMASWELGSGSKTVKNIVLVGRTGNGKSATGNFLLGKQVFVSKRGAAGVTMECQICQTETPSGLLINVIDTPGLFDLSVSPEYLSKQIINCLTLAEGGIHAVVLVLSVRNRITQEEESTLFTLLALFGSEILDYLVVLFTGGDVLEANDQTLDCYLDQGCPEFFRTVLRMCGGRKVLFDNKTRDENKKMEQMQQFLVLLTTVGNNNGGKPFIDKLHRGVKEESYKLKEQQEVVENETKNLAVTEMAEMKQQLQMMYEHNMKQMMEMVEKRLTEASAAHEQIIGMQQRNDQQGILRTLLQLGIAVPGIVGLTGGGCNIL